MHILQQTFFFNSSSIKSSTGNGEIMKNFPKTTLIHCIVLGLIISLNSPAFSLMTSEDIDSHKIGTPPFLSEGVNPNLLLIIDSSGSMYDLTYDDIDDPEFCNDDSYIPSTSLDWNTNASYHEGEIVKYSGSLYKAINEVTSGGSVPSAGGDWRPAFLAYTTGTPYLIGDIVTDGGKSYRAATNGTSNGATPIADAGVEWTFVPTTYAGYFDNDTWYGWDTSSTTKFTDLGTTAPPCDDTTYPADDQYSNSDACLAMDNTPTTFIGFAAKGNLLNWMVSSKFDIEKKILTGGKYNSTDATLMNESRGCLGRRMIKQFRAIDESDSNAFKYLSFAITSDYDIVTAQNAATQIQLFEPSDEGFQFANEDCEAAITASAFGQVQNLADDCLGLGQQNEAVENSNAAFNHGFQSCWGYPTIGTGDITRMVTACQNIYNNNVNPYDLDPEDSGYVCIGDYTGDGNGAEDGSGYVGRCINVTTPGTPGTPGVCTPDTDTPAASYTRPYGGDASKILCGNNSILPYGSTTQSCTPGQIYECETGYAWNNGKDACAQGSTLSFWLESETCVGGTAGTAISYSWIPNATVDLNDSGLYPIPDPYPTTDGCVEMAIREYCQEFYAPPVIDPSSEPVLGDNATTQFPNLPAILVDVATSAQLGDAIKTMQAQVPWPTPLVPPKGVLQDEAYSNIRFGLMTFNYDGSNWECDNLADPNHLYDCDEATNRDGSAIATTAFLHNGGSHISALADTINNLTARAWTPMAETMYNALGYYGQQDTRRLDNSDFSISATTGYAGDTNAPDGSVIPAWSGPGTVITKGKIITSGGELYWASDNGTTTGATFEDDTGVTWIPVDPVTAYCQSNNILILSDGAPTADLNNLVATFAAANADAGVDDIADCGSYDGSTYLDDLAYYGANAADLFAEENFVAEYGPTATKENLRTFVVTTGALNTNGTENECRADVLLESTAVNGDASGDTTTYFDGENPEDLETDLRTIFGNLSARASAGSAASVISSARGGEGAIYQAIFWPELERQDNNNITQSVSWVGDVHALFIDANGYLYEDTPVAPATTGDRKLDTTVDRRVVVYFDEAAGVSKGCINPSALGTCEASIDLEDINFIWSANDWLASLTDSQTELNRNPYFSTTDANDNLGRYIFTWNDLNNDGIVDYTSANPTNEVFGFVEGAFTGKTYTNRGSAIYDFMPDTAAVETYDDVNDIIRWIRGQDDIVTLRSRELPASEGSATNITWRLGDIIHSTPMVVSSPAEGYHLIYGDLSYANFYDKYQRRRQMAYFGANDGMLHAVNGGFYSSVEKKFCLVELNADGTCTDSGAIAPALGSELWAYVPYNILPHLKSLTKTDYADYHKYYIDLRPRIFDAKVFTEEALCSGAQEYKTPGCIHPDGWGTILVGGMRFGGAPIDAAADLGQPDTDDRRFTSSYFIFDITDPENPPILLGETTQTLTDSADADTIPDTPVYADLGYSTVISTMVIMKNFDVPISNDWYLILGSGPHGDDALKGVSDQVAKLAVLNLTSTAASSELVDSNAGNLNMPIKALRIPADKLDDGTHNAADLDGIFELYDTPGSGALYDSSNGFVSDPITIDFDINPSVYNYKADAVYFGTIEGDFNGAQTAWDGKGTFYRLVTRDTLNYGSGVTADDSYPYQWVIKPLIDLPDQPVSAAASVGTDGHNFWVYFGTGRFFDAIDKTDSTQQSYYGIKEPMVWTSSTAATFSWDKVELTASGTDPGEKGLIRVDEIGVTNASTLDTSLLFCRAWDSGSSSWQIAGNNNCLPLELIDAGSPKVFSHLVQYTSGFTAGVADCTIEPYQSCVDGWYKNFQPLGNRERNLGQTTLFGGLLTYTTYQPYADPCQGEGLAALYANYYQTGTAWYKPVFGYDQWSTGEGVFEKLHLGRGLAITPNLHTGGASDNPRVFIQTSTGEIKELTQTNLPHAKKEGRYKWREFIP